MDIDALMFLREREIERCFEDEADEGGSIRFDFELNIDEWNKQICDWKCRYDDNFKHFSVANKFLTKIFLSMLLFL